MQEVGIKDLFDINFLSDINYSQDGKNAAFVVSKGLPEENKYKSNIYIYSFEEEKIKKLTAFDAEKSIYWFDNENIIFPGARSDKDKELLKKGMPVTFYNKINIHGGEAEKFLTIPARCNSIKAIDEDNFLVSVNYDHNEPDYSKLSPEETEKAVKELTEANSLYKIMDEIPFWANGKGFVNKKRNRLYRYNKKTNEFTAISAPLMNVSDHSIDKKSGKIIYSGVEYENKMELISLVYIYDIKTKESKKISLSEDFSIQTARIVNESIILYGIPSKERNSCINSRFYKVSLEGGTPELFNDGDFSLGGGVGSDCKYGGGVSFRIYKDQLYYASLRGYSSYIFTLDNEGKETKISKDVTGSVDCLDVSGEKIVFIGVRDKGLQEIYTLDIKTGEEKQISDFNGEWLKNHFISYPEHFLMENRDGVELDGFVIKPVNYNPDKKYPAIFNIHGGPKAAYGDVLFHEMQHWASQGYFVFFTNPRGSDGKGSEFAYINGERYLNWDYNDLMDFTDKVIELYPQIDAEKIGVTGGSYGGLMVNWMVGHTNRFKAAATQRSISNFISKCLTTDIGYYHNLNQMGTDPWEGADIMWDKSPLKYADKCKTPLLFLHSDEDYRCYMADAFQMFTALKMFDVDSRMCLFHGENHELSRSGKPKNRIKRLEEITSWMDKYLK